MTGWTGYWLVWDERARQVALASAKWLDILPIFIEPMSRSFLVDETVRHVLPIAREVNDNMAIEIEDLVKRRRQPLDRNGEGE